MGATVVRYLHHDVNTVVTVQPLEAPAQQPGCCVLPPLHLQHAAGDAASRCEDEAEILPVAQGLCTAAARDQGDLCS